MNAERTHLYRGAPFVRNWSRYQHTVTRWTLCGIDRERGKNVDPPPATEDESLVDCLACRVLMPPGRIMGPVKGIGKGPGKDRPYNCP